ncbi:hypothetical protein CIC12_02320 [Burkholderia sp. SG-MS1]|uniref:hypothetical protein n=1 Tax=Paraburkholderia sp. SG-MS1 TaxID=2023741 RepID=UPI0014467E19|nr:hypothetical protein [Paraburkholderia sp. SG-MS1]NKJ45599.1 hypothetical protein [Paraburkholderia sp. SG-MS1]
MTQNTSVSKEQFIEKVGALADQMIAAYGADFAMGSLILAARFIAQGPQRGDGQAGTLVNADGGAIAGR